MNQTTNPSVCLICNGSCSSSRTSVSIFNEQTLTSSGKSLVEFLSSLLETKINEESIHSNCLCKKCFKSLNELEELEGRCNDIRNDLLLNYNSSLHKASTGCSLKDLASWQFTNGRIVLKEKVNLIRVSKKDLVPITMDVVQQSEETEKNGSFNILKSWSGNNVFQIESMNENKVPKTNFLVIPDNGMIDNNQKENGSLCDEEIVDRKPINSMIERPYENEMPNILKKKIPFDETIVKEEYDMVVSKNGDIYSCLICEASEESFVGDSKAVVDHLQLVHNMKLYICDVCGKDFKKRTDLSAHVDNHVAAEGGDYQCETCNRIFGNLRLYRIHKRMHAPQTKSWSCQTCEKKFNSKNLLDEHMNMHTGLRPYVCAVCGKDFASKYTFKAHEKTHEIRARPYHCSQCSKSFMSQTNLAQHQRTHLAIKEFSCHFCGKLFSSAHNLDMHAVVHTGVKPFTCGECGKAFARKAEIRDHERTHTGERPYQCELCGSTFSQRSNLQTHKRATHFNEKKFKCDQCNKAFKRRRLLDYHLKAAHTGERPYKCNICEATFVYPEHFKKHRRIHTGEKPFQCEVCGKAFSSRDNRNAHRFIHSDKKPYECLVCGAGFMRKPLLYQHMQMQGHLNDTIVVNQPRLASSDQLNDENDNLKETNAASTLIDDSKLYIAELTEEEFIDENHIIIDGRQITFNEHGEAEIVTADYDKMIVGEENNVADEEVGIEDEASKQVDEKSISANSNNSLLPSLQLVKISIANDNGEQQAWVEFMADK